MITGSSSAGGGEALPPHFQFPTKAKVENQKVHYETLKWMKTVDGKFGWGKVTDFGCTYGLNEKGGMNDDEFAKYMIGNVVRLFPDQAGVDGCRVLIFKCDGYPGSRMNVNILAELRVEEIKLCAGVPNTTAMKQIKALDILRLFIPRQSQQTHTQ